MIELVLGTKSIATYVDSIEDELLDSARSRLGGEAVRAATELPGGGASSTIEPGTAIYGCVRFSLMDRGSERGGTLVDMCKSRQIENACNHIDEEDRR